MRYRVENTDLAMDIKASSQSDFFKVGQYNTFNIMKTSVELRAYAKALREDAKRIRTMVQQTRNTSH